MSNKEKRSALLRIYDIIDCIEKIESYLSGRDPESFKEDRLLQDAVVRNLEIIGEAAKHVPDEICRDWPEIVWRDMKAMRDVIAHGYFDVDADIVWRVAQEELPPLREPLKKLYKTLEKKSAKK